MGLESRHELIGTSLLSGKLLVWQVAMLDSFTINSTSCYAQCRRHPPLANSPLEYCPAAHELLVNKWRALHNRIALERLIASRRWGIPKKPLGSAESYEACGRLKNNTKEQKYIEKRQSLDMTVNARSIIISKVLYRLKRCGPSTGNESSRQKKYRQ